MFILSYTRLTTDLGQKPVTKATKKTHSKTDSISTDFIWILRDEHILDQFLSWQPSAQVS